MNVARVLDLCADIYVNRICGINFFVPKEIPELGASLSAIRTEVETEGSRIEFAQNGIANHYVPHASSWHQPDKQTDTRPMQFKFSGKPKAFQLLRAIVEATSPGVFEISYDGEHGNIELSEIYRS